MFPLGEFGLAFEWFSKAILANLPNMKSLSVSIALTIERFFFGVNVISDGCQFSHNGCDDDFLRLSFGF